MNCTTHHACGCIQAEIEKLGEETQKLKAQLRFSYVERDKELSETKKLKAQLEVAMDIAKKALERFMPYSYDVEWVTASLKKIEDMK